MAAQDEWVDVPETEEWVDVDDAPAPIVGEKVYDPARDVTESIADFKLLGPPEKGNTTGKPAPKFEPIGPAKKPQGEMSGTSAAFRKYIQGLASSLGDEGIGAQTAAQLDDVPGQYLALPDGTEVPAQTDVEQYRAGRGFDRQETERADKKLGKWGLVPQIAGAIHQAYAGAPVLGAIGKALTPATTGMGAVRTAANVAGANALVPSAVQAAGAAEADLTKGEVPQFLGETALGTTMSTGTAGLMGGGGALAKKGMDMVGLTDWIKSRAQGVADKAKDARDWGFFKTLDTRKGDFKKMDHLDNEGDIAQFAFDNDMVGPATTPADLAKRAAALRQSRGADVGDVLDTGDLVAQPDQLPNVGSTLAKLRAIRDDYAKKPGFAKVLPQIDAEIAAIENSLNARAGGNLPADPRVSFRAHESDFKSPYDETLDWGTDKFGQKAAKDARTAFKVDTEKSLRGVNPSLADDFAAAKADVGNAASIEALAKSAIAGEKARRTISPSDNAFALTGGLGELARSGDPVKAAIVAALTGGANHLGRVYGPAATSVAANKVFTSANNLAQNGLPIAESIDVAANPALRQMTQEQVNRFIEWLKSQSPAE